MNAVSVSRNNGTFLLTIAVPVAGLFLLSQGHYINTPFGQEFGYAGKVFDVDPNLLRAIARKESDFNVNAISPPNRNGTRDYGLMQINETMARRFGREPTELLGQAGASVSINTAARLLASIRNELGEKESLYTTVAAYNAGSPAILSRGIFNMAYVSEVLLHYQFYSLGGLVRTA